MAKIQTKYDINDEVWTMQSNKPKQFSITCIEVRKTRFGTDILYKCNSCGDQFDEEDPNWFKTKDELIKSLLDE